MAKENNMNFQDLYQKIKNIEEGVAPVEECGMPMSMPSPGQQDSVTMSVNMNGNGSGGIKDLMNILKNIEQGAEPMNPHPHTADKLFGDGYENSEQGDQGAVTLDINDVVNVGTPINSGDHRPRQAGLPIGNPMQEALVSKLQAHYESIKGEPLAEWGINLVQPRAGVFGDAPAKYNDKANVTAMTAQYDSMIQKTNQEIQKLKSSDTATMPGTLRLIKSLEDDVKRIEREKSHNFTGSNSDDATNALRKQAIANNELTPGQWLQKGTQFVKGKVTGQPQPGVEYDRMDTSKQAQKGWATPTPYKPGN